jgi:hypothetical protein
MDIIKSHIKDYLIYKHRVQKKQIISMNASEQMNLLSAKTNNCNIFSPTNCG